MKAVDKLIVAIAWTSMLLLASMALLVPLYSDEVAMQMARSRFFVEDGHLLNLLPQCRELAASIPLSWYPGAAVNALLYAGADEFGLRLRGVGLCLVWFSILWVWAGRHPQGLLPRRGFQALVLSLNLLGVVPLVLNLARSEQLMVIALAAYCWMSLHATVTRHDPATVRWLKAVSFLILNSVFLLAHPKALFFFPLILVSCVLVFRQGGWSWMAMVPITGFMILQTFQHAQTIGQCTSAPLISQVLAQQTLDFRLLFSRPMSFVETALRNLIVAPGALVDRVPVTATFQSNWLPAIDAAGFEPAIQGFGTILKTSVLAGVVVLAASVPVRAAIQSTRRPLAAEMLLALALLASLLIHASIYSSSIWHFYTPGLIVPALTLLLMLTVGGTAVAASWIRTSATAVTWYMGSLAFLSMVMLAAFVAPPLVRAAKADDYVITGQLLSTPVLVGGDARTRLQALARQCGIRDGDPRLVVDGAGYFAFQHGRQPINVLYVSSVAFGADIGSQLPAFLKRIDSSGIISRCDYLPPGLVDKATVDGSTCCLSKSQLQQE